MLTTKALIDCAAGGEDVPINIHEDAIDAAAEYAGLLRAKKLAGEILERLTTAVDTYNEYLVKLWESKGVQHAKLADGSTVYITRRTKVVARNQPDLVKALRGCGLGELVTVREEAQFNRLNSWYNDTIDQGEEVPEAVEALLYRTAIAQAHVRR